MSPLIAQSDETALEQKIKLFLIVWALVVLSVLIAYCAFLGFSVIPVFIIIILGLIGALAIAYMNEKPVLKRELPADVDQIVRDTMLRVRKLSGDQLEQEINARIDPLVKSAEQRFLDGVDVIWKNGQKLRNDMQQGYLEVRRMLHNSSSLWIQEDLVGMYRGVEATLDGYEKLLNDLDKLRRKSQEDFEMMIEKLKNDTRYRLSNDKELTFDYIGSLLANQLYDEYKNTGQVLNPSAEKLVDQFNAYFVRRLDGQMENAEEAVARLIEDMAASVVGGVQSYTMSQINGCGQAVNIVERALNEKHSRTEVVKKLSEPLEVLEQLREEANNVLYSLAWQDMMVEKRWHEIMASLDSLMETMARVADASLLDVIQDHMSQVVKGCSNLDKVAGLKDACRRLKTAELLYVMRDDPKLAEFKVDGAYILFLYAAATEALMDYSLVLPGDVPPMLKQIRDDVKTGYYNEWFDLVQKELARRKPEFEVYMKDVYPQQFLNFCSSPSIRSKPSNANHAAWFLFVDLIRQSAEDAGQKPDILFQIGLLIAVSVLRNRYIHPSKGNQYIKLESLDRLEDMRTAALVLFQYAAKQPTA